MSFRGKIFGAVALCTLACTSVQAMAAQGDSVRLADGTAVDQTRLAAARPVVAKLFPVGTYRNMMGEGMNRMMNGMMGAVMQAPIADLARIGGLSVEDVANLDQSSLQEMANIIDPHFRDRMKLTMDSVMGGMADLMNDFEPNVREALARAYAAKFTVAQLGELDSFFSTPTGGAYAAQSMSVFMDPEMIREMQAWMPEMMQKMPEITAKAQTAVKALPPPRKFSDLSSNERKKLAKMLGVKESDLKDRPIAGDSDIWGSDDNAVEEPAVKEGTEQ